MKYFNNPQTLEQLKKQYKKLAMQHHPDVGGNTETMQAINNEYDKLFKVLKNIHTNAKGETYTKTTTESPDEYKNIISTLITLQGIIIELCGNWLWITGNTKQHKEILKSLKFRWSKSKCAWYFHSDTYKKKNGKYYTLEDIRSLYGSKTITGEPELQLAII